MSHCLYCGRNGVEMPCSTYDDAERLCGSRADGIFLQEDPTSPSHYSRWKIQPLDFIMANNLPFWLGNVIKYTMRYDAKNGLEDLKKARVYLDAKIKELEG